MSRFVTNVVDIEFRTLPNNRLEGTYTGQVNRSNERHGRGIMTYENGDIYDGEWKKNKKTD